MRQTVRSTFGVSLSSVCHIHAHRLEGHTTDSVMCYPVHRSRAAWYELSICPPQRAGTNVPMTIRRCRRTPCLTEADMYPGEFVASVGMRVSCGIGVCLL
jgi:hypothetical protein